MTGLRPAKLPSTPKAVRSANSQISIPTTITMPAIVHETPLDVVMRKAASTGRPAATWPLPEASLSGPDVT